jgi:hypothetical protein
LQVNHYCDLMRRAQRSHCGRPPIPYILLSRSMLLPLMHLSLSWYSYGAFGLTEWNGPTLGITMPSLFRDKLEQKRSAAYRAARSGPSGQIRLFLSSPWRCPQIRTDCPENRFWSFVRQRDQLTRSFWRWAEELFDTFVSRSDAIIRIEYASTRVASPTIQVWRFARIFCHLTRLS